MSPVHIILDLTTEGITTALEVLNDFRTRYRDRSEDWVRNFFQKQLIQLYEENYITVFLADMASDEEVELDSERALEALNDSDLLTVNSKSHCLMLLATDKGTKFYYEDPEIRAAFE